MIAEKIPALKSLSTEEKLLLINELWDELCPKPPAAENEREAVREAIKRDEELSSGAVTGRTHAEVMQAARRAIGCA